LILQKQSILAFFWGGGSYYPKIFNFVAYEGKIDP